MAVHANRGAIDVTAHAIVIVIRIRLIRMRRISCMASVDTGKDRVVGRIDVAIGTARPVVRNTKIRMVEDCTRPGRRHPSGVAGSAGSRIGSSDVVGDVGAVGLRVGVVRLMATVAIGGGIAGRVVAADVAVRASVNHRPDRSSYRRAWREHVRALQREAGGAVVKLAVGPHHGVVAGRAKGSRETRGDVVRNVSAVGWRAIPGGLMAAVAIRVGRGKVVVVVDVAVGAGVHFSCRSQLVRARERPAGHAMVEDHVGPRGGVVAIRAVRGGERRARAGMRGIVRLLPSGEVALGVPAVGRSDLQIVIRVDVARRAGHIGMRIGERKSRGAVIKFRSEPAIKRVAGIAGLRKLQRDVTGAGGVLKISLVTRDASS